VETKKLLCKAEAADYAASAFVSLKDFHLTAGMNSHALPPEQKINLFIILS